jgi:glycosyltransferase involved in cell wall biosynthesis
MIEQKEQPLVSVVMITYRHEEFIRQAVEGVLMQKTSFPVELIIADDCSPDETRAIVQEIQKSNKNGKWINYTRHESNKGMMSNFVWGLKRVKGKYIALCEGDDFWTDSRKLQKQFNYMENNPRCSLCFHKVNEIDGDQLNEDNLNINNIEKFYLNEILSKNYAHTPSIMFRADELTIPAFFYQAMPGDHVLQCILLRNGGFAFYMKQSMAVYRKHSGGVWSSDRGRSHLVKRAITKLKLYEFLGIYDKSVIKKQFYMLADGIVRDGYNDISFIKYRRMLWKYCGVKDLALSGYISFPKLYQRIRSIVKKYEG